MQFTKKFYFFHFIATYLILSNLATIVGILVIPYAFFDALLNGSIHSLSDLLVCLMGPVGTPVMLIPFPYLLGFMFGFIFQILAMIIKLLFKRTIFVTSDFFLNNKIYDKFYICSVFLIFFAISGLFLCLKFN